MTETFLDARITLEAGDCRDVLARYEESFFDSCLTDPPYHLASIVKRFGNSTPEDVQRNAVDRVIDGQGGSPHARAARGFQGQLWDGGDISFKPETWTPVLRVLKPGAYLLACSHPLTYHRMACAIEDAGFIIRPFVAWMFGVGFPKAHRITLSGLADLDRITGGWEGWRYGGQALKPAIEPVCMAQKPFEAGLTGSENVQRWGVGAINIDGCRIATDDDTERSCNGLSALGQSSGWNDCNIRPGLHGGHDDGRWPANVAHDGSDEVLSRFFFSAKADANDRLGSGHPTVKPVDLMQWFARLVTPPGGHMLDPFAGTGTAAEAAWREGLRATIIEREPTYLADIRRRMALVLAGPDERARESFKANGKAKGHDDLPLFLAGGSA